MKGWRTLFFNGLVMAGGIVAGILDVPGVPAKAMLALGVVNVILRVITTGPVGTKT